MNTSESAGTRTHRAAVGCALVACGALGAAYFFPAPAGDTARARYEQLRPEMTLEEAQQALGHPGSDAPPADLATRYRFTCSAVYGPSGCRHANRHYWPGPDGLVVAQFDADGALIGKLYHRAVGRGWEDGEQGLSLHPGMPGGAARP